MTLFDILRHQWRRWVRAPTFGRSLIGSLLLVLAAAYFGLLFGALGWFYPQMVAEVAPGQEPLRLLNEFLLYGAVGLLPMRFFLQRSAGSDVRPYLHLPLRRSQVVRVLQVVSSLSLLNLLPVVVLAALWGSTVLPGASPLGAALWAAGALLVVALTQFANSLLRVAWDRNAGLVLGAAGVLAVGVAGGFWTGGGLLRPASMWLFGGLAAGHILPLLMLIGGATGMAVAAHRALRGRLYSVLGETGRTRTHVGAILQGEGRGWGRVGSLALLDLKLILRNKRPRQMMLLALLLLSIFVFNLVLIEETGGALEGMNRAIFGCVLTSMMGVQYGQFGHAWHGRHYDHLLLRTRSPRVLVRTQTIILTGLCAASFLVVLPVIALVRPSLVIPLCAFLIYNVGVTVPVMIGVGAWRRKAMTLQEGAMLNYQGTSSGTFASGVGVGALLIGIPVGLVLVTSLQTTLIVVAGLGLLGAGAAPLWTRGLGAFLWQQRHAMAAGFREE
ncbi:DUF5687 family protein [Salinibacter grassmerensis]|uniref:DUF5687 family protein n=1 Tax=Salinibacter grassmerensis TaxID=3040353 RepID=UPI0021E781B2|nr:DUF5687 family protein [Salinibacter grassmerensis]